MAASHALHSDLRKFSHRAFIFLWLIQDMHQIIVSGCILGIFFRYILCILNLYIIEIGVVIYPNYWTPAKRIDMYRVFL